jgi:hypothetical protein
MPDDFILVTLDMPGTHTAFRLDNRRDENGEWASKGKIAKSGQGNPPPGPGSYTVSGVGVATFNLGVGQWIAADILSGSSAAIALSLMRLSFLRQKATGPEA